MRHLNLTLEKLEERIAPCGPKGGSNRSDKSHRSKSSKSHRSKSSKSKGTRSS